MSAFFKIEVKERDLLTALQDLLKTLVQSDQVDGLLVPCHLPVKGNIMSTLITDPENLNDADPLAPCFPVNGAKIASKLTRRRAGQTIGLVMRPCEIRAFAELTKFKQGSFKDTLIISVDCLGALANSDYAKVSSKDPKGVTRPFYENVLNKNLAKDQGSKAPFEKGVDLAPACRICEHPVSDLADINIALFGLDHETAVAAQTLTPKGEAVARALNLEPLPEPSGRTKQVESLVSDRIARRDRVFEATSQATDSVEKLSGYLSRCVNCYNCRVACPVCYCRECVFVTEVFDHDPFQVMKWAKAKGRVKLPTDTDFFHLTRMAHISLTCVGCGQCSNACPNDIPLMELFRTVAHRAQAEFDYEAGRNPDEPIPFAVFNDKEYEEVVGTAAAGT